MTSKLWKSLNDFDEKLIDLEGIRQHLNYALTADSSKTELENAMRFVLRLLDRFEHDLDEQLKTTWEAYRQEKTIPEPQNNISPPFYPDVIN